MSRPASAQPFTSAQRLASGLLCALLLAGCTLPPQPAPPLTLQMPGSWRAPNTTGTTTGSTPASAAAAQISAQWWQTFGDPVLNDVVARALAQNTDLRVARARLAEYRARLDIARAAGVAGGLEKNSLRGVACGVEG